ncbi:FK506-binding protein FKBP12 [Mortierella sp. GBAus27b]|nr:FK506-binding protein FKBP12 [Mortierella sp. GBAus27b]
MGVTKTILQEGDKKTYPQTGQTVVMHYVGTLNDGTTFDSSRDRGKPFETEIGKNKVIRGWEDGVPTMSLGEKAILKITPDFGYGTRGYPPVIPANAELTFEVELLQIK